MRRYGPGRGRKGDTHRQPPVEGFAELFLEQVHLDDADAADAGVPSVGAESVREGL